MRFYDYIDPIAAIREATGLRVRDKDRRDIYGIMFNSILRSDPMAYRHFMFDVLWRKANMPYYNVYPSIIDILCKLNLDFPGTVLVNDRRDYSDIVLDTILDMDEHVNLMFDVAANWFISPHLLIRLPCEQNTLTFDGHDIRTILMSMQLSATEVGKHDLAPCLVVGVDIGEYYGSIPIYTMRIIPLTGMNISDSMNALAVHQSINDGIDIPDSIVEKCVCLAVAVILLGNDHELVEPEVLSKDAAKYMCGDDETRKRLVDKAIRRGKYGFTIGKEWHSKRHVAPHLRRPHPALVWTGPGRTIPKIVMRKGSVVHRNIISKVPTGYHADK